MHDDVDVRIEREADAGDARRMREHELAACVRLLRGGACDVGRQRANDVLARRGDHEQLRAVGAAREVVMHSRARGGRIPWLLQLVEDGLGQIAEIKRDSIGRVDRPAGGEDARPAHLAFLDARPDRDGIREIRTGVEDGGHAITSEHRFEGAFQFGRGFSGGGVEARTHQMHVAVLESRHDDAPTLGSARACRDRDARPLVGNTRDLSIAQEHRAIRQRLGVGRGVDFVGWDQPGLGLSGGGSRCAHSAKPGETGENAHDVKNLEWGGSH